MTETKVQHKKISSLTAFPKNSKHGTNLQLNSKIRKSGAMIKDTACYLSIYLAK